MIEKEVREGSDQESRNKRAGAQDNFQSKGGLETSLVECGAPNRGAAHADITKVQQETNDDACKSNDSIIRRAKVPGHNQACHGYANQRGALGNAGVDDITKSFGFGNSHQRFDGVNSLVLEPGEEPMWRANGARSPASRLTGTPKGSNARTLRGTPLEATIARRRNIHIGFSSLNPASVKL
jgi:hypothetical protein